MTMSVVDSVRVLVRLSPATLALLAALVARPIGATAQAPTPAAAAGEGIPVTSDLVIAKCASCHKADEQKRLTRISYRRASPENWERTIKRMVSLNGVALEPAEARAIVKYLADRHGLAPEEVKPVAFESERRNIDYAYTADKETADTCSSCHSMGRVLSERRTKPEWELLLAMHRGYYPLVDNQPMNGGQGFRRTRFGPAEPAADGRPPDTRHPMERVIAHLAGLYPLSTPEWASWSAAVQPSNLAGRWALSGYAPGRGPVFGTVTIAVDPSSPDVFSSEVRYTAARSGETVTRTGRATVFTGFQWRGRGAASPGGAAWSEVMALDRTRRTLTGRWFSGAYDETGIDVTLTRVSSEPIVSGTDLAALRTGSTATLRIYGANLPAGLAASDISLGQGVTVGKVVSATTDEATVEVTLAATAPIGPRDLTIVGATKPAALIVFDKAHGIRVTPRAGLSRLGGGVFPRQMQQFEAVAVHNGPDGKPNTQDDWSLGIVDPTWALEEYTATFGDDDLAYVGTLDKAGLFTPNLDGPNPKRKGNRNNVGDVWVVAELPPSAALGTTTSLRARAHLLVTVPVYMRWNGAPSSSAAAGRPTEPAR
jgi:quinohemoprotein amine dehydrogenase